ncbi:hypothetical protein QE152_g24893 [Popillia japonica]|uniref:Uncharacterized protein n=1 Tax=Popillia japonica TaxID=7064 RepID=A0AAW1K3G9_POPJA
MKEKRKEAGRTNEGKIITEERRKNGRRRKEAQIKAERRRKQVVARKQERKNRELKRLKPRHVNTKGTEKTETKTCQHNSQKICYRLGQFLKITHPD